MTALANFLALILPFFGLAFFAVFYYSNEKNKSRKFFLYAAIATGVLLIATIFMRIIASS